MGASDDYVCIGQEVPKGIAGDLEGWARQYLSQGRGSLLASATPSLITLGIEWEQASEDHRNQLNHLYSLIHYGNGLNIEGNFRIDNESDLVRALGRAGGVVKLTSQN